MACTASGPGAALLLAVAALSGCGAPGVQLAAPVPAPQWIGSSQEVAPATSASASPLASETLWITVRDARTEGTPRAIGVARMTMGIPREIQQAGEWDLARAIGHGLGTGLQNAGWEATGFDPPADAPVSQPGGASSGDTDPRPEVFGGWTLRLILDQLWCDGYFNEYSFKLGLRLHLLDPSGRLRSRAEFRQEFVEEYKHPADFAYQVEVKTREALSLLLVDLGLARGFPSPGPGRAAISSDTSSGDEVERGSLGSTCPKCERSVEAPWKHCPDCGFPLSGPPPK